MKKVATDELLRSRNGFNLIAEEDETLPSVRVKKASTLLEFKEEVAKQFNIPVERQRIWKFTNRSNLVCRIVLIISCSCSPSSHCFYQAFRPETLVRLPDDTIVETALTLRGHIYSPERIAVYIDDAGDAAATQSPTDVLLFLKFYNPEKQELTNIGHFVGDITAKLGDVKAAAARLAGLPEDADLLLFEENPTRVSSVDLQLDTPLRDSALRNGDIIVVQRPVEDVLSISSLFSFLFLSFFFFVSNL